MSTETLSRRDQILQALVEMLEKNPGARITTATLAKTVGVSEAALYRHFPSKAKMFEGLITFIEDTVFSRIKLILEDCDTALERSENIMTLILTFSEKNPGMCRLLAGDALAGETDRLRSRIMQFFDRIETQIKQVLREAELKERLVPTQTVGAAANILVAILEGRIRQYVRTEFKQKPTQHWPEEWQMIKPQLLRGIMS